MIVNYVRINPSGNITLLVTDAVPRAMQSEIANRLMHLDSGAEQVGFLEEADMPGAMARLQMMGGEFCGNATMSAASWLASRDGLADGEEKEYRLQVSGAEDMISCRIRRLGERYSGVVPMPLPREIAETQIMPGLKAPLVRFDGIIHAILPDGSISKVQAEEKIAFLCAGLNCDAMGILLLSEDGTSIRPLVYVRSTDTAVWENSCGSGTAAIGAWQAHVQGRNVQLEIGQPYPDTRIGVSVRYADKRISHLEISGRVRLEKSRRVEI